MLQKSLTQSIILLLILAISFSIIGADELPLSEIFVPYNDEGFYGGSIIILFVIYVLIPLAIIVLIGAGVAYLLFPKTINEFKLLIGLYYDAEWREALSRHFIHFLLFVLFAFAFLFLIYKLFDPSYFYLLMLLVFLYSSFFGLYVFLYCLMALYFKNWKKVLIALFMGGAVFVFFVSSGYFVIGPIYKAIENKNG